MNQCKRCFSTNITYVTNYEHLSPEEDYVFENGWLCDECECFMIEDNSYYSYFSSYQPQKVV